MTKDWEDAKRKRDTGMANAESGQEDWMEHAVDFTIDYAHKFSHKAFYMAEDVVELARESNIGAPRDPRAWGPVMKRVEKLGIIANVGYGPAKTSNVSPKVKWATVVNAKPASESFFTTRRGRR